MSALVLDGKALAEKVLLAVKKEAESFFENFGRKISLAVILVGDNPASKVYVAAKSKFAERAGIEFIDCKLPENLLEAGLIKTISQLNQNSKIDGILLQLPLPNDLCESRAVSLIDPLKDVDGLTSVNIGKLLRGERGLRACTPLGCMMLIDHAFQSLDGSTDLAGKNAIVIGRSNLVGKPLGVMLLERGCTVTFAHSKTRNLAGILANSEIICVAIGKANFIAAELLPANSVVIDVGINRIFDPVKNKDYLAGDVEYKLAFEKVRAITPVPGGVGPMTVAILLKNTVDAAFARN